MSINPAAANPGAVLDYIAITNSEHTQIKDPATVFCGVVFYAGIRQHQRSVIHQPATPYARRVAGYLAIVNLHYTIIMPNSSAAVGVYNPITDKRAILD